MSLPQLLLVDDSEAILAFERAALGTHYACTTAKDGEEALQKAEEIIPAAILLDLSMPKMDGDEVLARLKLNEKLAEIPVIIISSETSRAEICLEQGAVAFLAKPIRADELRLLVERVLNGVRLSRERGSMAILPLMAGGVEFAVPLDCVQRVLAQVETQPLPLGPHYLREVFTLGDVPVCVLDVTQRLGQQHASPIQERKLVVISHDQQLLALCVDEVSDPMEVDATALIGAKALGGTAHGPLAEALIAVAQTERGPRAVIDPAAFLSRELLRRLSSWPATA